jgi:hypothetical protein
MTAAAFKKGRSIAIATIASLFSLSDAHGTEPTSDTVSCLVSVLRGAASYVAVEPAEDMFYYVGRYKILRRGVNYSFRNSDGIVQTVGVYLETEFERRALGGCNQPERCVVSTSQLVSFPSTNGRFALTLEGKYPSSWYPPAFRVQVSPNDDKYVQQYSPLHPLYGLWGELASTCRIDNTIINSPTP